LLHKAQHSATTSAAPPMMNPHKIFSIGFSPRVLGCHKARDLREFSLRDLYRNISGHHRRSKANYCFIGMCRRWAMNQRRLFEEPAPSPSFPSRRDERANGFVPLSELSPGPAGTLKGIARIAAAAEEIDQRNDVEYLDLPCKSLLSPCDSRRVPFDYTINPYRGCEFGCVYCFARYTHEYMELQEWEAFERRIFVKRGAPEALLRDLRRRDLRGKWIAIGSDSPGAPEGTPAFDHH
jgi:hypothetical protein